MWSGDQRPAGPLPIRLLVACRGTLEEGKSACGVCARLADLRRPSNRRERASATSNPVGSGRRTIAPVRGVLLFVSSAGGQSRLPSRAAPRNANPMKKGRGPFVCAEPAPPGGVDWSSAQTRDDITRDIHASSADDRTIRLLLDVHPAFEGLRTVAGQLAGLLILAAAGASKGRLDGTLLDAARLTYKETRERVLNLAVEDAILHVGHHLRQAAEGLEATFANVER
jgi:hypothetical protein